MDAKREVTCSCKIGRQANTYDLRNLSEDLRRRREEGDSLRDLAAFVNKRILGAAIDASDADVAGDVGSVYAALADDEVSTERRVNTIDQLDAVGVDAQTLKDDFVSYQSVRNHLRNCLDMDTGRRGIETAEEGREVIEWARSREENIIERTLSRLRRIGLIASGDIRINSTVTVECTDCGNTYTVDEFLDRRACECSGGLPPHDSD